MDVDEIVAAVRAGVFSMRDLVRISCALARHGKNTTSVLGQYGEKLVAAAYGGTTGNFSQKGYDVITADGEKLQVKTFTTGKRPGVIRSFVYDVVTVEIDPTTADVVSAPRYRPPTCTKSSLPSTRTSSSTSPTLVGLVSQKIDLTVAGLSALGWSPPT